MGGFGLTGLDHRTVSTGSGFPGRVGTGFGGCPGREGAGAIRLDEEQAKRINRNKRNVENILITLYAFNKMFDKENQRIIIQSPILRAFCLQQLGHQLNLRY